jgi:hypothetical protein
MYFASAQLALRATHARWPEYLRVQIAPILTAAAAGAAALAARLACEGGRLSAAVTAVAILAAAAVPWSAGAVWMLGAPRFAAVRAQLPAWCRPAVDASVRLRRGAARDVEPVL